jgi:hypothetical protein
MKLKEKRGNSKLSNNNNTDFEKIRIKRNNEKIGGK